MRILFIVMWLLLGVLYWWIWGQNSSDCCNEQALKTEQGAISSGAIDNDSLIADPNTKATLDDEDLNDDGIPDKDQDFSNEDLSNIDLESIDPEESASDVAKVVETDDSALIHFPYNSTYKLDSKAIEEYLNRVAQRVQQSGEMIRLTGHGDIIGNDESNIQIGQHRANTIRDYLIAKGVSPKQIKATSKGRSQPIASNKTREGRAKNRRVEIIIEK